MSEYHSYTFCPTHRSWFSCTHADFCANVCYLNWSRDNLIFVHAIFLPCATLCAFISIACVHKILTVYSIMSTHLNYLNYNKIYSHANKKYMYVFFTFFSVLSRIVLHSSKFGCSLRSHIRWKDRVSTFLFSCKMLRSLVFWYCSSFFCPLDLSGPWWHRRSRKFIFLHYTPSKI